MKKKTRVKTKKGSDKISDTATQSSALATTTAIPEEDNNNSNSGFSEYLKSGMGESVS